MVTEEAEAKAKATAHSYYSSAYEIGGGCEESHGGSWPAVSSTLF